MKIHILAFILLFLSNQLLAQLDSAERQFVHRIIRMYQKEGTIYYGSHPMDGVLASELKDLSKRVIVHIGSNKDSIVLSAKERRSLLRQIKRSQATELNDQLFPNAKRMASDSIAKFVTRKNIGLRDSLLLAGDTAAVRGFFAKGSSYKSFFFTKPAYIRNRSIMLFHFTWLLMQDGGEHGLTFYRIENNQWVEWILVSGGAW
jgi:hypothetical protein